MTQVTALITNGDSSPANKDVGLTIHRITGVLDEDGNFVPDLKSSGNLGEYKKKVYILENEEDKKAFDEVMKDLVQTPIKIGFFDQSFISDNIDALLPLYVRYILSSSYGISYASLFTTYTNSFVNTPVINAVKDKIRTAVETARKEASNATSAS